MLGSIDGEIDVGRRGLVTHLLLAPLTGECLGRRPGEARPRPAGEPAAVALQPRGLVEAQHNDDLFGKHRCLDLAPQPAERERCDRRSQLGMRADIATPLVEGHRDVEPSVLAHDTPRTQPQLRPSRARRERKASRWRRARSWSARIVTAVPARQRPDLALIVGAGWTTR